MELKISNSGRLRRDALDYLTPRNMNSKLICNTGWLSRYTIKLANNALVFSAPPKIYTIYLLFKKGDRNRCGNYREISLLSVIGKLFGDIILWRLHQLAEMNCPKSEAGFRNSRSTTDGIFHLAAHHAECRQSHQNFCIAFTDLTKALDYVNRELLFKILDKLGYSIKFIRIIKQLHTYTQARLITHDEFSRPSD